MRRHGISQCPEQLSLGLYFRGSGYALAHDLGYSQPPTFSLLKNATGFTTTISFRSAALDAMLIIAWRSPSCYAYLGLVNGQVGLLF